VGKRTTRRAKLLIAGTLLISVFAAGCASSAYVQRHDEDQRLSALVDERLAASLAPSAGKVEAKSHWGVVALLGEVSDESLKNEAERVAGAVPGVVRVNNLILVMQGVSRAEGSAPAKGTLLMTRAD
jgi:hypothetical protein